MYDANSVAYSEIEWSNVINYTFNKYDKSRYLRRKDCIALQKENKYYYKPMFSLISLDIAPSVIGMTNNCTYELHISRAYIPQFSIHFIPSAGLQCCLDMLKRHKITYLIHCALANSCYIVAALLTNFYKLKTLRAKQALSFQPVSMQSVNTAERTALTVLISSSRLAYVAVSN